MHNMSFKIQFSQKTENNTKKETIFETDKR